MATIPNALKITEEISTPLRNVMKAGQRNAWQNGLYAVGRYGKRVGLEVVEEEVIVPIQKSGRRTRSKFNKAVSAGMKAVRASSSYGKKGTINNAKRAFSAVTKVASKVNRGKKVSAKGVTGTIARAVRRIL